MSRKSDAKKTRRRKRQAERAAGWIPEPAYRELVESGELEHLLEGLDVDDVDDEDALDDDPEDEEFSDVADAVADFDEWMHDRGWVLDTEQCGEDVFTWVYPPSAAEAADGTTYPVTRTFIGIETEDSDADDGEVSLVLGVILVGMAEVDETLVGLQPEQLLAVIDAVESYRPGMPIPSVG